MRLLRSLTPLDFVAAGLLLLLLVLGPIAFPHLLIFGYAVFRAFRRPDPFDPRSWKDRFGVRFTLRDAWTVILLLSGAASLASYWADRDPSLSIALFVIISALPLITTYQELRFLMRTEIHAPWRRIRLLCEAFLLFPSLLVVGWSVYWFFDENGRSVMPRPQSPLIYALGGAGLASLCQYRLARRDPPEVRPGP